MTPVDGLTATSITQLEVTNPFLTLIQWPEDIIRLEGGGFVAETSRHVVLFDEEGREVDQLPKLSDVQLIELSDGRIAMVTDDPNGLQRLEVRTLHLEDIRPHTGPPAVLSDPSTYPPGTWEYIEMAEGNLGRLTGLFALADGKFMVGWTELPGDSLGGIFNHPTAEFGQSFVQIIDENGKVEGEPFSPHALTPGFTRGSDIAVTEEGFIAVGIEDAALDGDGSGVFLRRWASDGTAQTDDILVNATTEHDQRFPKIAELADGRFVVVYVSYDGDDSPLPGEPVMLGRLVNRLGTPVGDEFQVGEGRALTGIKSDQIRNPNHFFDYEIETFSEGGFTVIVENGSQFTSPVEFSSWASVHGADGSYLGTHDLYPDTAAGLMQGGGGSTISTFREEAIFEENATSATIRIDTFDFSAEIASATTGKVGFADAKDIALLYEAGLNRNGGIDLDGLNFWIDAMDSGLSLLDVSEYFVASEEFSRTIGNSVTSDPANLTDRQVVEALYENVLDRPGEAAGVDFWTSLASAPKLTDARLLLAFAQSEENRDASPFVENLWEVSPGSWDFV